jgi:tetratricopeptide (TPR) repeat protein
MTKLSHLMVLAVAAVPMSASAAVISMGNGYAVSCYEAAEGSSATLRALDDCNRALTEQALPPQERVATLVNRGIILLRRSDVKSANADFDAALQIDPRQPEAWLNKAVAHARFGKSTDALPLVAKALEYGTRKPALAYFVRAMGNEDSGNLAAAYHDLQRAQQLDPKWEEPRIELQRFRVRQL